MNQWISTHLVANTTGVWNPTGQRTSSITEVVLVYSPVFVLVPSTAGKLGKRANRSQSGNREDALGWLLNTVRNRIRKFDAASSTTAQGSLNLLLQQSKVNVISKEEAEQPKFLHTEDALRFSAKPSAGGGHISVNNGHGLQAGKPGITLV